MREEGERKLLVKKKKRADKRNKKKRIRKKDHKERLNGSVGESQGVTRRASVFFSSLFFCFIMVVLHKEYHRHPLVIIN